MAKEKKKWKDLGGEKYKNLSIPDLKNPSPPPPKKDDKKGD
ncbi:hypothetical protein [Fulvivirga lutea]|nr:hypothetical protein [Fulvivirga lutea]